MSRRRDGRGLTWGEGTIGERPRADGSIAYRARWHASGRWHARTFDRRDDAEDHLRAMRRAKRDGRDASPSGLTVAALVTAWLARGQADWSTSTAAAYRQRAERHVIPALGSIRLTTLTAPRIQSWIDGMRGAGLAPRTIDGVVRTLTGALNEAVRLGILSHSPAHGVKRPAIKPAPHRTWTAADVGRVMAAIPPCLGTDEPMWTALYRVALTTALRPGELRAVRWTDLDLDRGVLRVRRTLTKDAAGHVIMGERTKTGDVAAVALPPACVVALRSWQTAQTARRVAADRWHDDGLVFERGNGRFLPLTSWQRRHEAIIAAAGVPRITPHELRHTAATLQMEAGVHPKIVADLLRHRKIETTLNLYSHVSVSLQRAAADVLAVRLFGTETPSQDHDNITAGER